MVENFEGRRTEIVNDIRPKAIALTLIDSIYDEKLLWLIVSFAQGLIENDD